MTAPSLRDRIAQAVHEEQPVDAVLAVLADADPTDLGFKWVDGITYCTFHDATVTAERARTGACDRAHHFCAEVPVYARPLHRGALMAEPTVTAPSLRDRIAAAWSDHETGTLRPEGYVPCSCGERFTSPQALSRHRASVILEVLADADPTDIGGRTLAKIQMLERERDAMQRRTFELAEQIAAVRAELPEVLDLLRAVVERCVPAVLDAQARPTDDLWGLVWRRLGTARPRPEEAHTVDIGHVHVLTTPGGPCASSCPHPDHRTKEETTDG